MSNDQRRKQSRHALEEELRIAVLPDAADEDVEERARGALAQLDELVLLTERPGTVRRFADELYTHFADFATGMGDPPADHPDDYPWVHPLFVRAWARATGAPLPESVVSARATPAASAQPPSSPAPVPVRTSGRLRARSPSTAGAASSKRPRPSSSPEPTAPPAKQPKRDKGKGRALPQEDPPAASASETDDPIASIPTRASTSKLLPVEKKAGYRRAPKKKTVRIEAPAPRKRHTGLPQLSPPVYPRKARLPNDRMKRCTGCRGREPDGGEMRCIMREGLDRCDRCWYGRQSCHLINPVKASGKMAAIQGRGYADWYRSKGYSYAAPPIAREVFNVCHIRGSKHLIPPWVVEELTQELGRPPVYPLPPQDPVASGTESASGDDSDQGSAQAAEEEASDAEPVEPPVDAPVAEPRPRPRPRPVSAAASTSVATAGSSSAVERAFGAHGFTVGVQGAPPLSKQAPLGNGATPGAASTSLASVGATSGQTADAQARPREDLELHQEASDDGDADGPFVPSASAEDPPTYWPVSEASFRDCVDTEVEWFRREFTREFRQSLSKQRANPPAELPGLPLDDVVAFRILAQQQVLFKARSDAFGTLMAGASRGMADYLEQSSKFLDKAFQRVDAQLAALASGSAEPERGSAELEHGSAAFERESSASARGSSVDAASSAGPVAGPSSLRQVPLPGSSAGAGTSANTESATRSSPS